jgi:hypothetical protein
MIFRCDFDHNNCFLFIRAGKIETTMSSTTNSGTKASKVSIDHQVAS